MPMSGRTPFSAYPARRLVCPSDLAANDGQRWTAEELTRDFEVIGFAAPFVVVRRRADGQRGSLEFTYPPRAYFGWRPDDE